MTLKLQSHVIREEILPPLFLRLPKGYQNSPYCQIQQLGDFAIALSHPYHFCYYIYSGSFISQWILCFNPVLTSFKYKVTNEDVSDSLLIATRHLQTKRTIKNIWYLYHRSLLPKSWCCTPKSWPLLKLLTHPY